MKFSLAALVAVAISGATAFTINTPSNVVQCQPIQFSWDSTGATGPFFLSVHPGSDPNGAALFSWTGLTGTSFSWSTVAVPGGQSISLTLRDSTGNTVQSAPFPVETSGDSSCLNASGSSSSGTVSSTSSGSSPASSGSGISTTTTSVSSPSPSTTPTSSVTIPTTVATSRVSSITSRSSSVPSSGTSSGTSSTPSGNGAAGANVVRAGVVGAVGAVLAAVLA